MSRNEKGIAANDALNTDLKNKLTMNNDTPSQPKFQLDSAPSRANLLEQSKLSRLPERSRFAPFTQNTAAQAIAVCVNCNGRLDADDSIQQSVKVCRKYLTQYAVIDAAINAASKRKRQAMLEKFAPEVER